MKRISIALVFTVFLVTSLAGPIFQYDPTSPYVTNRGVRLFKGNTLAYLGKTNYLVFATNVPALDMQWLKASNGVVAALTAAESNLVVTLAASNDTYQAGVMRQAIVDGTIAQLTGSDTEARLARAMLATMLNGFNNSRTQSSSAFPLGAFTTNILLNALSNNIRNDPR